METKGMLTRVAEIISGKVPETDMALAQFASHQPAGTVWRLDEQGNPIQQGGGETLKDLLKNLLGLNNPNPHEMRQTLVNQLQPQYNSPAEFNTARMSPYGDVNAEVQGKTRDLKSIITALLQVASGPSAGAAPTKMSQLKRLDNKLGI